MGQFAADGLREINVEGISQAEAVDQDIGQLIYNLATRLLLFNQLPGFLNGQPLKVLH